MAEQTKQQPPPNRGGLATLWWTARNPPADPNTSFAGKTVLVTGSNTGLGLEAAVKFAALGASSLILAVRTLSKGEAAKTTIVARSGCKPDIIKVMQLDMSSAHTVQAFADKLSEEVQLLDVALLNAGVVASEYTLSSDGWETTIQVNVLSTALLAILLLPKLRHTAAKTGQAPHLEIVGSGTHLHINPDVVTLDSQETSILQKLNRPEAFSAQNQYAASKLLVMYVMQALLAHTTKANGEPEIIITTTCPGFCRSELGRNLPWYITYPMYAFQAVFARTSEQGGRALVSGAGLGADSHGKFWKDDTFATVGAMVTNEEGVKLQRLTWKEVLEELKKHVPAIENILTT